MSRAGTRPEAKGDDARARKVEAWLIDLDKSVARHALLWESATADERARAERFRSAQDADRFLANRRAIATLAGDHLGCPPSEISVRPEPSGRPQLYRGDTPISLHVSSSRSGGWGLVALSPDSPVGVDLEVLRPDFDYQAVAERALTNAERATLAATGPEQAIDTFLRFWVRKEAYVKALGQGLGYGLQQVDVDARRDGGVFLPLDGQDPEAASRWAIAELPFGETIFAAICAKKGASIGFRCWREV